MVLFLKTALLALSPGSSKDVDLLSAKDLEATKSSLGAPRVSLKSGRDAKAPSLIRDETGTSFAKLRQVERDLVESAEGPLLQLQRELLIGDRFDGCRWCCDDKDETPTPEPCTPEPVDCDFSTLQVNVKLTDAVQAQQLLQDCGITASAIATTNELNVFDSSIFSGTDPSDDPDLGSPNMNCPGGGPGVGDGGAPGAAFPNCDPQGNILIIQNPDSTSPNDSPNGGCLVFDFVNPAVLDDVGVLDVEEQVNVIVTDTTGDEFTVISPPGVGDNGFWPVGSTANPALSTYGEINKVQVCLPGSGAVTYLRYSACPVSR